MKHQDLIKLYELRGQIKGMMGDAKVKLIVLHNFSSRAVSDYMVGAQDMEQKVTVRTLRNLNSLRRKVSQMIKEGEDV